jgi:hypothetical protein
MGQAHARPPERDVTRPAIGGQCRRQGFSVALMHVSELGDWEPLRLEAVIELFSASHFRWWIGGGLALELYVGRSWRSHEDSDVGVLRRDLDSVHELLASWDLHVAAAGRLSPWRGEPLDSTDNQNNVWCRRAPDRPWALDVTIGEGSDDAWIYRRDRSVKVPWDLALLHTADGIPYLAPELQLLFKSKEPRPKDDVDATAVIPELDTRQRMSRLLKPDHPWQDQLH